MAVPGKFEFAVAPDLSADPLSYTWVDGTALTQSNSAVVSRGRSSAGASETEAAGLVVPLTNSGDFTPYRAAGAHYPNMRRGLVVARHYVNVGARTLLFDGVAGSRATTPDAAGWAISPDLAGAVQFRCPLRIPAVLTVEIIGQFNVTGNQRAWVLFLGPTGNAGLRVSSDGTAESDSETNIALPAPAAGHLTLGWEFDGDNGDGGNTTTWYVTKGTITDLLADKTAYLFGDPDINSGTLTIHDSTGTPGVGDIQGSGFAPYPGGIDAWFVRAGTLTSGTIIADTRNLPSQASGTTAFADQAPTPKTWTLTGGAAITDRKITITGHLAQSDGDYPAQSVAGTAQRAWQIAGPLRRMRQGTPALRSALYRRINAPVNDTTVRDYYPLEDGREATVPFAAVGGGNGATIGGDVSLSSDDTFSASEALPSVSGGQSFGWNLPLSSATSVSAWEYTMLVRIPVAPDAGAGEFLDLQRIDLKGGVTSQWVLRIDDANWSVFAKDRDGANVLSATGGADPAMFGTWMIVSLTVGLSGSDITWDLDLIPVPGGVGYGGSGTLASFGLPAGSPRRLRNLVAAAPQEGLSFGHFIVTEGAVAGWLAPADTAYAGEPDTARVFRLFREEGQGILVDGPHGIGVASGGWERALAAGAKPMGPQRPGLTLLEYLDECAQVGNGIYGEAADLFALTYRTGATLINQAAALTVSGEALALASSDSDRDYVNDATVTRVNGSEVHREATGIDAPDQAGRYDRSRTVNPQSDLALDGLAAWWLHEATWPEERFDDIPVELAKNSALYDPFFGLNLGDKVVVTAAATPGAAAEGDVAQLVDGWTLGVSPHNQRVGLVTRPAGPWSAGTIDANPASPVTSLARIEPTSPAVLAGSLSDSATGGQSVTVTGTLWTTAAGYFPLDVLIDGEQITLSAISGGASPQTFTISARSVNGVVKAHSAGAEIHPFTPFRIALARAAV